MPRPTRPWLGAPAVGSAICPGATAAGETIELGATVIVLGICDNADPGIPGGSAASVVARGSPRAGRAALVGP